MKLPYVTTRGTGILPVSHSPQGIVWMTLLVVLAAAGWVAADERGASVAESAPVSDLLKRARDGVRRGEWKFAVDSLQRIIDDPQGALTTLDGEVYESARMQAYRQLGALPAAGQNTYHLLYDGGALRLYEAALASGDFEKLQHVVDRYLLTVSGSRAALTLANWYVDLNKPGAAITILTDLRSLLPRDDRLVTTASAMLAVAYAQLQRGNDAQGYLDALRQDRSLPEPWQQRIAQIETFLAGQLRSAGLDPPVTRGLQGGSRPTLHGWPMAYGDPARTGRMPATTPVLLDGLPWRYDLPLQSPPPWSAVIDRQARDNLLLSAQMVTDGENLYLKAENDVAAIDLLNFELRWISKGPAPTTSRRSGNRVQRFDPWGNAQPNTPAAQEARLVQRALWDDVDSQLSIAHGLIFDLVVDAEQAARGIRFSVVNLPRRLRRRTPVPRVPNVLIARDPAQQGRIVWSMGSGQDVSSPPHKMIFASTPVAAGPKDLLVTYWSGKDLYAGLLNPADGDLLESIYLCTMAEDFLRIPAVLPPALDDQFAYIPTNAGLLLALNLGDRSLRWASRYERTSLVAVDVRAGRLRIDAEVDRSGRWLTGPPLVAGATVLLAPSDSDYLYAFNRATGKKLWAKERGEHTYIVAADNVNLWLGGRYLTMVELASGNSVWHVETQSATGRAVLSGTRLLVPTRDGLLAIDSESGERTELQPLPTDHPPLGNLLCWDGALYSIDSQRVRKFPDLEQSYEPAKRMHAADPTDATAAIRLAWMELLRQQPEQVLSTLEGVVIDDSSPREGRALPGEGRALPRQSQAANVAHLRVQALLASVRLSKISSAEAEGRLRQACELARTAQDRFQATVALANRLVRNHKKEEAYQRVWRLAQTDEMTSPHERTPLWKRSMRAALFDKLADLSRSMSPAQQTALAQKLWASTLLDAEPTRKNRRELRRNWGRLAEGDDLQNWNQLAALKLGRLYQSRRKFEQAEYYYRRAANMHPEKAVGPLASGGVPAASSRRPRPEARSLPKELTATALVELGQMYVGQGPAAASLASSVIDRLGRERFDVTIEGATTQEISQRLRDELQVQSQRAGSRIGSNAGGEDSIRFDRGIIAGQPLDLVSADKNAGGAGSTRYAGNEFMLAFSAPNHLAAYRPGDGKRIWPVTLRLPSESSLEDDTTRRGPLIPRPLQARTDGQTLVLNTETSLHAVGLITGRRLWSIPINVPEPRAQNVADGQLFDIRSGRVAVRMNAHQLDLRRSVDGHDRLWSVQIPDYIVGSVRIVNDRVVAVDHHGLTAIVFNLHDGEKLFEITFTSAQEQLAKHLLVFHDLICGVEDGAIAAYSLADGKQLWTRPFEFSPTSFFRASDQCGLVAGADGNLLAFAVRDGEILYEGLLHSFPTSGLLVVHHEQERLFLAGKGKIAGNDEVQLAAIDLKNDELLWINDRLKSPICGPQCLRILPNMIPLLYPQLRGANRNQPKFLGGQDSALVLLDKRTGELAAEPLLLKFDTAQTVPSGELAFWPGRVAIGTSEGIKIAPLAIKNATTPQSW